MAKKITLAKAVPALKKKRATAKLQVAAPKADTLTIDYPRDGEPVCAGHYAIRLTAAEADLVQIRIDGGDWQNCRQAVGHYWFDWAPRGGDAHIESRSRRGNGRWTSGPSLACVIVGVEAGA